MIKVLHPGFYSSIQDGGRLGWQDYGVPISGAMDRYAFHLANALLGNGKNLPVIEMTMMGGKFQFNCANLICITGADMSPTLNGVSISNNKVFAVNEDDILSFGKLRSGFRSYLGIKGGFKTYVVMGSSSMYQGITATYILKKGDQLKADTFNSSYQSSNSRLKVRTNYLFDTSLDVLAGPEYNLLDDEQKALLFKTEFTVSSKNGRMGYQLEGLIENKLESIITSPVLPGTVQLTPSGNLIVLMRDCQTTGGYPRVLQLTESAINILAQKYAGNSVKFNLLSFKKTL